MFVLKLLCLFVILLALWLDLVGLEDAVCGIGGLAVLLLEDVDNFLLWAWN